MNKVKSTLACIVTLLAIIVATGALNTISYVFGSLFLLFTLLILITAFFVHRHNKRLHHNISKVDALIEQSTEINRRMKDHE